MHQLHRHIHYFWSERRRTDTIYIKERRSILQKKRQEKDFLDLRQNFTFLKEGENAKATIEHRRKKVKNFNPL